MMQSKNRSMEELLEMAKDYVKKAEQNAKMNPKTDTIQVVVVESMKKPYKKTIPNTLDAMQDVVGGYIELVTIGVTHSGGTVAITLNEQGKLDELPFNRRIHGKGASDVLVGTFFITAFNMQGDNISLNDAECEKYIKRFLSLEVYL